MHRPLVTPMGEVIVEGKDRYGEGVNIATRLEQLAEPGGIYVSGKAAREVEKKLAFGFEPMVEQKVKNIAEPISVFRVKLNRKAPPRARRSMSPGVVAGSIAALLIIIAAGSALWLKPWTTSEPDAITQSAVGRALPRPVAW
jgi:hypothetical protein